MAFVEKLG